MPRDDILVSGSYYGLLTTTMQVEGGAPPRRKARQGVAVRGCWPGLASAGRASSPLRGGRGKRAAAGSARRGGGAPRPAPPPASTRDEAGQPTPTNAEAAPRPPPLGGKDRPEAPQTRPRPDSSAGRRQGLAEGSRGGRAEPSHGQHVGSGRAGLRTLAAPRAPDAALPPSPRQPDTGRGLVT